MNNLKDDNTATRITQALFCIYLLALLWILVFKMGVHFSYMGERRINLKPFGGPFLKGENVMNTLIFVPLGIYVGVLFCSWGFIQKVLMFPFTSFLIESLQYILR